mgnify:CR=1 FL=1
MKTFNQFFTENKQEYILDDEWEDYIDLQGEYVYNYEAMEGIPHAELASLIYRSGTKLFSVTIDGLDPSADGTEHYYVVNDKQTLKDIATLISSTGEDHHQEFAMEVGTSSSYEFIVQLQVAGFSGEETGDMNVFLVTPGGSEQLQALLRSS